MSHHVAPIILNVPVLNRLEPRNPASLLEFFKFERFTLENTVVSPYKYTNIPRL